MTFFVSGPKFSNFFRPHFGRFVVDQVLYRFSLFGYVPEIFAIKVDNRGKSRRILEVFCPQKFCWAGLPKVVPKLSRLPPDTCSRQRFTLAKAKAYVISTLEFPP